MIFPFFFSLISLHAYSIIVSMSFENHSFVSDDSVGYVSINLDLHGRTQNII